MNRIWPFSSFWHRQQYSYIDNADIARLPRELNPYEMFVVRWLFVEAKLLLLIPVGIVVGWLIMKVIA